MIAMMAVIAMMVRPVAGVAGAAMVPAPAKQGGAGEQGGKGGRSDDALTEPLVTLLSDKDAWVRRIAGELAAAHPDTLVATVGKAHRVGRVFIDWSQNHPARSTATPYTLRAKGEEPTAAAPRDWDEIGPGLAQLGPAEVVAGLRTEGDRMARWGLGP